MGGFGAALFSPMLGPAAVIWEERGGSDQPDVGCVGPGKDCTRDMGI